ncbi:MAG: sulfite exporter TauE/SafE family protein [Reichenbachiella sp.]|uniref:sulfite exporter TauE/SafE family protein n=1 Tax=Reichenbachiella sp. TaxID=2184521 RepID=UPI003298437E
MHWTALFLGFVGSLHCVVMCGPIALALSGQSSLSKFLISRVLYNIGRVFTYAFIGLLFGLLGELVSFGGYQQAFSIGMGLFMIMVALAVSSSVRGKVYQPMQALAQGLKKRLSKWLRTTKLSGTFLLGILNGFLPCGLVYAAVAGALATASFMEGAKYMIIFGLGTFPAMLLVAISGRALQKLSFISLNKLSTVFIFTLGCLLIIRGLNLDIPYLSPAISFLYPTADITVCE